LRIEQRRFCRKGSALIAFARRSTLCRVQIVNRTNLSAEAFAQLAGELPAFGTLQQFVAWNSRQQPPVLLLETIAQDEYTHDVIAAKQDGLFLVFGST
jgi:hypothetical protein